MNITAVIPVRENPNGRLPNKCLLPFRDGLNLTQWKIRQLLAVFPPENIVLSTNSPRLKQSGEMFGIRIHHRSDYLSDGDIASWPEVVTSIVKDIDSKHIAITHVTNPHTGPDEYKAMLRLYERRVVEGENDSLITVNRLQGFFWDDAGPVNYFADKRHQFSQDVKPLYRLTCAAYVAPRECMIKWGYPIGPNPYKFETSITAGVDIDTKEDYRIALSL